MDSTSGFQVNDLDAQYHFQAAPALTPDTQDDSLSRAAEALFKLTQMTMFYEVCNANWLTEPSLSTCVEMSDITLPPHIQNSPNDIAEMKASVMSMVSPIPYA